MEQPKRDATERKLVIKSFKVAPKIPSNFLETTWNGRLLHALNAIHDEKPCEESYERLYRAVEDVVVGNFGNELYEKLRQCLEARTEAVAKELKEKCLQGGSFYKSSHKKTSGSDRKRGWFIGVLVRRRTVSEVFRGRRVGDEG